MCCRQSLYLKESLHHSIWGQGSMQIVPTDKRNIHLLAWSHNVKIIIMAPYYLAKAQPSDHYGLCYASPIHAPIQAPIPSHAPRLLQCHHTGANQHFCFFDYSHAHASRQLSRLSACAFTWLGHPTHCYYGCRHGTRRTTRDSLNVPTRSKIYALDFLYQQYFYLPTCQL